MNLYTFGSILTVYHLINEVFTNLKGESKVEQPLSKFQKSRLLVRGAWHSLMLDKKLITIPLLTFSVTLLILIIFATVGYLNPFGAVYSTSGSLKLPELTTELNFKPLAYALFLCMSLAISLIGALGIGAVTHGAIERFKGNSPTVKSSLLAAWKRKKALLSFVLFSFVIGYIINEIASRIPYFGGAIVSWLAGAAWGIASFFAIPIIVEDEQSLNPVAATKKSLSIMKQIWGESLIVAVGIGAFELFIIIIYMLFIMLGAVVIGLMGNLTPSLLVPGLVLGGIAIFALFAIVFIFSVLEIFVKAALYYYATTGESPATFDKNILRQAFTTKKAKKVFSI